MAKATVKSEKASALQYIRTIYLSAAALIGLIVFVIGTVGGLRTFLINGVFQVDEFYYSGYYANCETMMVPTEAEPAKSRLRTAEEIQQCKTDMDVDRKRSLEQSYKRDLSNSISMAIVGLPIWLLHFMIMQKDWRRRHEQ